MLHAALHVRQKERSTNGRAFISAHPEHGWNTGQPTWQDLALISNNFALNSEVCEVRFVVGFGLPLLSVSISRRGTVSPRMYVEAFVMNRRYSVYSLVLSELPPVCKGFGQRCARVSAHNRPAFHMGQQIAVPWLPPLEPQIC